MLRFFRQLRKQLMEQNNIRTYFFYAIGEILLVVIGILIALQVNNWNERNKLDESNRIYLERLHEDITAMKQIYITRDASQMVREARESVTYIRGCDHSEEYRESLEKTLLSHQTLMMYPLVRGTYDEMLAGGAFARIQNDSLKTTISDLYSYLDFGQAQVTYFRDEVGRASAIIWEHADFWYDEQGMNRVDYDFAELCNSRTFRNAMAEIVDARSDWQEGHIALVSQMDKAIAILNTELGLSMVDED